MRNLTIAGGLTAAFAAAAGPVQATTITFDDVTNATEIQTYSSTLYAAQGRASATWRSRRCRNRPA